MLGAQKEAPVKGLDRALLACAVQQEPGRAGRGIRDQN